MLHSVFLLRSEINKVENAHASLRLVLIHVVNFIVWALFYISVEALNLLEY